MIEQAIRVLSIEDNPAEAMLIQEKLAEARGVGWDLPCFAVEHVDCLETALARLDGGEEFDVVLSDLDLPDSQAGETVATLREHIPHMPLVVLTGREDETLAHKSVQAGVQDYLYKNEATGSLLARSMMYAIERQQAHTKLEQRVEERTSDLRAEITERKRAEEALRESEEKYRALIQNIQAGVVVHRADTRVIACNTKAQDLLGLTERQMLGKEAMDPAWQFLREDGTPMPLEEYPINQVLRTGRPLQDLILGIDRPHSDDVVWVTVGADPVFDAAGDIEEAITSFMDITARKRAEAAILEERERLGNILAALETGLSLINPDMTIAWVNRKIREMFPGAEPVGQLCHRFYEGRETLCENCGTQLTFQTGEVQTRERQNPLTGRWYAIISQPIKDEQGNVINVLEGITDITERKRAEEALRASEAQYRLITQNTVDVIWTMDVEEQRFTYISPSVEWLRGYTPDEVMAQPVDAALTAESARKVAELLAVRIPQFLADPANPFRAVDEVDQLHKDGSIVHTEVTTTIWFNSAGRLEVVGISRDITERKRMEQDLRTSEEEYRVLFESFPLGITVADSSGQVLEANVESERLLGISQDEHQGRYIDGQEWQIIRPDGSPMPAEEYASVRALQGNRLIENVEMGIVKPDKAVSWINVTAAPLMNDRVVITYNDITERKRAERAVQESKALLAKAEQLAHLGSWEWDIEPDQFTLSEGWQRVHGCHIGQLSSETLLPIAHPDDRARIEQAFDQALKGQQPYDIEHRIIRQDDGEVRIIQAYGEVIRDAHGNPIKMYGATQDITDRKRAEHALQQRNRRLAELNAIVSSLTSTLSLEEVLQRILEATPQFFSQKHSATIQLLEEDGNLHQRAASNNIPAEKRQNIFRPGEGIAGRVVEEQRPINVADVTAEPDYLPGPIPPYYRSLLVVPLVAHNQLLGTLSLSSKRVGAFDIRDIEMLQGLAGYAAIAVYNAQLYEQTQQDAETKALLLREVNHRVKNNLDAIIGLLYVERRYAPPEALSAYRPIMDDLTQRITGLSEVHQMLSGGEWAPLNLSELAERIIQVTVRGARDDVNITLDVSPASVYVRPAQAQHLALILSELTTNTLKYGVNGRDAVHIAVRITQEDDIITLIYRNDGSGYPEDVLRLERHSAGLDIVKRSVRKNLRGELTLRNEDGAVTEIRFRAEDRK